ncbi:hypothetical protein [Sinomonas albida]|uniref:hypothetical protein n=1 Tax=Sinomonas albida TaxID=369942 RepID=UPI003019BD6A
MRHQFSSPFRRTSARSEAPFEHEQAAHFFIARSTEFANDLDAAALALQASAPATARHLRLLARQFAGLSLTAIQTWPKAVLRHDQ